LRACLMARVRRRWCVVQTPVSRRGTIFPRSATKPCSRRTSRRVSRQSSRCRTCRPSCGGKTFRGRGPRMPGTRPRRMAVRRSGWTEPEPEPEPGPDSDPDECGAAPVSGAFPGVSSGMMFPLYSSLLPLVRCGLGTQDMAGDGSTQRNGNGNSFHNHLGAGLNRLGSFNAGRRGRCRGVGAAAGVGLHARWLTLRRVPRRLHLGETLFLLVDAAR